MFSFTARKKIVDIQRHVRRVLDLTVPNKANSVSTERCEDRYNRAIPALLCAWEKGGPDLSVHAMAITKDIADQGMGLILTAPFCAKQLVLGFFLNEGSATEPWFFRAVAERQMAIGGGFWLLGIKLTEFMDESWQSELEPLLPLAQSLLPPQD